MNLLSLIVEAVQSFRHRRGAFRPRKRAEIRLEQLDHRQLLAVNFTGNIANDFTAATPAVFLSDPNNHQPGFPPGSPLQELIKVSGFAVDQIAVNYDQATDTLSVGFLQPLNQKPGLGGLPGQFPVIAGDADNNGNNSTTDPAVTPFGVVDDPGISETENFNVVIDLSGGTNTATQSIFAGIPNAATPGYTNSRYVVAPAVFASGDTIDSAVPQQGAELTQNEGTLFLPFNNPQNGALEFSIPHFAELYQQVTGKVLVGTSQIAIGASAGSGDDELSEEVFNFRPLAVGTATTPTPVPPPPPPPVIVELFQPTILINPHENRHVNTAHYDDVRVTVLSSASFDATLIDPTTVTFGGASPIASFHRIQLHDGIPSETFVFKGTDINLPPGLTSATISGKTLTGVLFTGSEIVFNRDDSFYNAAQIRARDARLARFGVTVAQENGTTATTAATTPAALTGLSDPTAGTAAPVTVRITPRQAALERAQARQQALLSTIAAQSFQPATTPTTATTPPAQSASATAAALLAHDLALQSVGSSTTGSAV